MGTLGKKWKLSDEAKKNHSIAMKGKNVGRKLSEEHKAKIGKSMLGDKNPMKRLELRKMFSEMKKGKNAPNWRGGVSKPNELARKSLEYRAWRKSVFERDNYTCQDCGVRAGNGKKVILHADHIRPFAYFPELRYVIDNGKTLCVPCHKKTPSYGSNGLKGKNKAVKYLEDSIN